MHRLLQAHHSWQDLLSKRRVCIVPATSTGNAAALLYGDWGTSKAYVIGFAFVAAGFSSFPLILAVCAVTAVVGFNYIVVCAHFPDGGGVYSAARQQRRFLASTGALLLVANFIVTAVLSGWAAVSVRRSRTLPA